MSTASARPERLQRYRETAGEVADGLEARVRGLARAVGLYEATTEPTFRTASAAHVLDAATATVVLVRELAVFVGAVGDAFAAVGDGDVVVAQSSPGPFRAPVWLAAITSDFGEQWEASADRDGFERVVRSVADAGIETGFTVGAGAVLGVVGAVLCEGAPSCVASGVAVGQHAGHWLGERVTGWLGLGDDPPPGVHDAGEVRDDVRGLGDDRRDLEDELASFDEVHDRAFARAR